VPAARPNTLIATVAYNHRGISSSYLPHHGDLIGIALIVARSEKELDIFIKKAREGIRPNEH